MAKRQQETSFYSRTMIKRSAYLICCLVMLSGCASSMVVSRISLRDLPPSNITPRQDLQAVVLIPTGFENYSGKLQVPNWAMGALMPDRLEINVGSALAWGVKNIARRYVGMVSEAESFAILPSRGELPLVIIAPEITRVVVDSPLVRFTNIQSWIGMRYTIYDKDQKILASGSLEGTGTARLMATKDSYKKALERAAEEILVLFDAELGRSYRNW